MTEEIFQVMVIYRTMVKRGFSCPAFSEWGLNGELKEPVPEVPEGIRCLYMDLGHRAKSELVEDLSRDDAKDESYNLSTENN